MADPRYEEMMARQATAGAGIEPAMMVEEDMTMGEAEDEGRGGDTILAHLTPGELVVPAPLVDDPEFQQTMSQYFEENQLNISQYIVGNEANSMNPETGHPEFGFFSFITKPFKKAIGTLSGARQTEKAMKKASSENRQLMEENQKFQKQLYEKQMTDMKKVQAEMTAQMAKERAEQNKVMQLRQRQANRASILRQRAIKAGSLATQASLAIKTQGEMTGVSPTEQAAEGSTFGRRLSRIKSAPRGGMGTRMRGGRLSKRPR